MDQNLKVNSCNRDLGMKEPRRILRENTYLRSSNYGICYHRGKINYSNWQCTWIICLTKIKRSKEEIMEDIWNCNFCYPFKLKKNIYFCFIDYVKKL